jgi:hypothetical protein
MDPDKVLDRQKEFFDGLQKKDPRIKNDFFYRAKMNQWCLMVAREDLADQQPRS